MSTFVSMENAEQLSLPLYQPLPLTGFQMSKLAGKQPVNTVVTPGLWNISWEEVGKGLTFAIASAVIPIIRDTIAAGSWLVDWNHIGQMAVLAALAYLGPKFVSPTQQIITYKKVKKPK